MKFLYWILYVPLWLISRVLDRRPNYFIYTHRRGFIHCSEATEQDYKEVSGYACGYVDKL